MHNRWRLLVVMAPALGAFGADNNSAAEQSAAAAISTTTTIHPPTTTEPTPTTSTTNPPADPGPNEPETGGGAPTPEAGQETTHRVAAGESLWTIAEDHLAETAGGGAGQPTLREVAAYWLRVIEANRDQLASGDPDLIYPGERIALPPVD
jgi:hypothetical protein